MFIVNHPKVDYWIISTDFNFLCGKGWRQFEQDSEFFPNNDFWKMLFKNETLNDDLLISNRLPFIKSKNKILESFKENQGSYEFKISEYGRGYISLKRNNNFNFNQPRNHEKKYLLKLKRSLFTLLIESLIWEGK